MIKRFAKQSNGEYPYIDEIDKDIGDKDILVFIKFLKGFEHMRRYQFERYQMLSEVIFDADCKVTEITDGCFLECPELTSIILPQRLQSIGFYAFLSCKKLASIEIPPSVSLINIGAFYNCAELISIKIPNGVEFIASFTFCNCHKLQHVELPPSLKDIQRSAFFNCRNLQIINLPPSLKIIGECAFENSGLFGISIPASVVSIGEFAFRNCKKLNSVVAHEETIANLPRMVIFDECVSVEYFLLMSSEKENWKMKQRVIDLFAHPRNINQIVIKFLLKEIEDATVENDEWILC